MVVDTKYRYSSSRSRLYISFIHLVYILAALTTYSPWNRLLYGKLQLIFFLSFFSFILIKFMPEAEKARKDSLITTSRMLSNDQRISQRPASREYTTLLKKIEILLCKEIWFCVSKQLVRNRRNRKKEEQVQIFFYSYLCAMADHFNYSW